MGRLHVYTVFLNSRFKKIVKYNYHLLLPRINDKMLKLIKPSGTDLAKN